MVTSIGTVLCSTPFCDGLQQHKEIGQDHVHATFWLTGLLSVAIGVLIALLAPTIADLFSSPHSARYLPWALLALPLSALANLCNTLLARELRFAAMSQLGALIGIASGLSTVAGLLWGIGGTSLLLSSLLTQGVYAGGVWAITRYRPGWPRQFSVIRDLTRFNMHSLALNVVGFSDSVVPRLVTGLMLGPAALGYYLTAERILQLMTSLVMSPLASVTMASVARLQDDAPAVRQLIRSLYRLAAALAYPACLGLIVVLPDLVGIIGDRWQAALVAAQILILTTLRTTTGMFNMSILRGLGDGRSPLILLGSGLALNVLLVPAGAWLAGVTGVAAAALARTWLTWPLGCIFIRRATGLSIREQLSTGAASFLAAGGMTLLVAYYRQAHLDLGAGPRLAAGLVIGAGAYILLSLVSHARVTLAVGDRLLRGDRSGALRTLRQGMVR